METGFCLSENKEADQMCNNCTVDQPSHFRFTDRRIPFSLSNPKFQASSLLIWLYSLVCVEAGRKRQWSTFSRDGSIINCSHAGIADVYANRRVKISSNDKI